MVEKPKLRILLADDHVLFRKGLKEILSDFPEFEVVAESSDGSTILQLLNETEVDILLMDLNMPGMNGIEATHRIRARDALIKIIMLTVSDQESDVINSILAGVDGYILKNEDINILVESITKVYKGEKVLSERILPYLFKALQMKNDFPVHILLSNRELEVMKLLAVGKKNEEIAEALFISENTVKTHLKRIYEKMSVNSREEAVNKGILWGLL